MQHARRTAIAHLGNINLRDLSVRLWQKLGQVSIQHIEGAKNIADIFTKESKDVAHFQAMAEAITAPRLLSQWTERDLERHGERRIELK